MVHGGRLDRDRSARPYWTGYVRHRAHRRLLRSLAAEHFNAARGQRDIVVGHADWHSGNLRFAGDRVVAAFDWDLLADVEPVVVGLKAGGYADLASRGGMLADPVEPFGDESAE